MGRAIGSRRGTPPVTSPVTGPIAGLGGAPSGTPGQVAGPGTRPPTTNGPGAPGGVPGVDRPTQPTVPVGVPAPPRLRRRPLFVVAGVLAVALGALLSTWLFTAVGTTRPVLAMRNGVDRGEVITAADLMAVALNPDPALRTVPGDRLAEVVGKRAVVDLAAGGVLVDGSFTEAPIPAAGHSLVGVWLGPGQLPGEQLRAGDRVRVVTTPRAQEGVPGTAPVSVPAVVVSTKPSPDGHTMVTVTVPTATAAQLAAIVATARIALVLDPAAGP